MDLPTQTLSARNANAPRNSIQSTASHNKEVRKSSNRKQSNLENTISLQEAVALFPSLQRLLTKKEKSSVSSLYVQSPTTGFTTLQKKLKSMLEKDREDENFKIPLPLPEIKPEEILSCRLAISSWFHSPPPSHVSGQPCPHLSKARALQGPWALSIPMGLFAGLSNYSESFSNFVFSKFGVAFFP